MLSDSIRPAQANHSLITRFPTNRCVWESYPVAKPRNHPNRHVLSRSVGNDMFVAVDINDVQVQKGDLLVLCSDGLHGAVPESDIASVVMRNENLPTAAEKLVALANQRDGSDNVSVQLVRIHDVERTGMYRGRPYKLP